MVLEVCAFHLCALQRRYFTSEILIPAYTCLLNDSGWVRVWVELFRTAASFLSVVIAYHAIDDCVKHIETAAWRGFALSAFLVLYCSSCMKSVILWVFLPLNDFRSKRGLAIACRPSVRHSVRPSVTLVICDHIAWKTWKIIARANSPTPSLFAAKMRSAYSQGNMEKFWRDYTWGRENGVLENKSGNIYETRKDGGKLLWTAYRNSPTLFRTVPSPTPYGFPFLEIGGLQLSYPLLSQEQAKLRTSNLAGTFTWPIGIKAH